MRWKAIYLLLALLALFGILGFFFLDSFLGWSIEKSLETVTGAKVEVKKLHLDLFRLKISIGNLQITNPKDTWHNLVETQNISFQMAAEPLYSGKIVIEEVSIEDLMINTLRKTDGKLKKFILPGPFGRAQRKLNKDIASIPVINPESLQKQVSTEKLFASYQMKTEFSTVEVRNQIEASNQKWQNNLKKLDEAKAKIADIQEKFEDSQATQPKSLSELKDKLESLQKLSKSGQDIQTTIGITFKSFSNEFTGLKTDILNLKNTAEEDFRALLKLAKLPDFQSVNMAEVLFGKALLNESTIFLNVVDNLQKQIPIKIENPPKEKHPRGGQNIIFPGRRTYPRFLVKHVSISTRGTPASFMDGYYMKGIAAGITNEPQIYGLPMLVKITGKTPGKAYLNLNGSLNHITPMIDDRFSLTLGELPLPDINLPKSRLLPGKISSGSAFIFSNVHIEPNHFMLDLKLESNNIICDYSGNTSNDLFSQIVKETLTKIDKIAIQYQLEGINKKLKMRISSNIDQLISSRLKTVIGAKVDQAVQEIRQRVNDILLTKQHELEVERDKYQKEIEEQLNQVQELLNKERQEIDKSKKDLEDNINQQLEKEKQEAERVKKEVEDKLRQEQDKAKKELEEKIKAEQEKAKKELENKLKKQLLNLH
jgi:uncharacterized protein (TIGR03545 family)